MFGVRLLDSVVVLELQPQSFFVFPSRRGVQEIMIKVRCFTLVMKNKEMLHFLRKFLVWIACRHLRFDQLCSYLWEIWLCDNQTSRVNVSTFYFPTWLTMICFLCILWRKPIPLRKKRSHDLKYGIKLWKRSCSRTNKLKILKLLRAFVTSSHG